MQWEAWTTLGVLIAVLGLLAGTRRAPDAILMGGLAALLIAGVLSPKEALAGFSNEGVATIAALFAVAAGLRDTAAVSAISHRVLGRPASLLASQFRVMVPAGVMSAFMNNTPLVAILLPVVGDWARRQRVPVSKLLIPLSFASILGGACTLVGTSTHLVVNGWLIDEAGLPGLGMFDISRVAVPCAVVGIGFLLLAGRRMIPDRQPAISLEDDPRSYTAEMTVDPGGPLVGKTIEEAGLRHLPGAFLMEIDRDGEAMAAVGPRERLRAGDRLIFVGVVESMVDLQRINGLTAARDQLFKLDGKRTERTLIEAVVSDTCPLVGRTIREGRFRTRYQAVVVAVARSGERIRRKLGDIVLRPGDTLLVEARPWFVTQLRNHRDFFLVSLVEDSSPPRHDRAPLALGILALMVGSVALGWLSMLKAALLAAGLMIVTRCCTASAARRAIDWPVLLVLAASIGLGKAMAASGLAEVLSHGLIIGAGDSPRVALAVLFTATMILACLVTAKASAVLMLPMALAAAHSLEVSFMPFAIAVMLASATTLATPIGYPTNLMIYGPGGYRFTDYLRVGLPVTGLVWLVAMWLIPAFWPF